MKLNKKATALLLGLTLGISGTAFAADGADSFSDVPQGHWAYDALDYLAKDGVIDGMGDGTFQGNRTMTRYEMASIVAKAMQKGNLGVGDQAVLEKLEKEYGSELATLSKQVNANTKAIKDLNAKTDKFKVWGMARVQMGDDNGLQSDYGSKHPGWGEWNGSAPNGNYNNRFYMDLEGQMKINDHAVARFTVEKNAHYRDSEYLRSKIPNVVSAPSSIKEKDGTTTNVVNGGQKFTTGAYISGVDRDSLLGDDNHNGSISNIWVELQLGPKHDWYTNIGRKWNGIGMQNLMLGGQVDGIATYHPIEHGHGWWMSAQYWKTASDWTTTGVTWKSTDSQSKVTIDGKEQTVTQKVATIDSVNVYSRRAPIVGTLNFWGPIGKYVDLNLAYSRVVQHRLGSEPESNATSAGYYTGARNFYGVDLRAKLLKDFTVTGSYLHSDAKTNEWSTLAYNRAGNANTAWAVRFDYRGTNLDKVGTWGLYAKWMDLGAFADLGHDDEWATREPTYVGGVRGWYFGFKMVPWKNVEWETMWAPHLTENINADYDGGQYKRHILRSWLDFHF
ncbi:S-layer homology domain-containing protein [Selenomonas bovis]|uniref:S-layer homology domain-containing protein n=1 Tax=Selenomonas bovis TaxID=416586 RepID=UPI003AB9882F